MRVRMLGTGASDGWPNPWCTCASCRAAADAGVLRGQTSAMLDDRLLIDLGPDGVRAAARSGVDLTGVRTVLITHAHPDHHAWPAWMWRGWVPAPLPLTLVAPPAVLADAAAHLDPTVTTVVARPGGRLTVDGYDVVVLPARHAGPEAGPAVLYDITDTDGSRLLYATDTGELASEALELVSGRAYDAVLLDLTSGHGAAHHDLVTWPEQVAELRRRGAVVDTTAVHAIHLGHGNPPPAELDTVLAGWGASAPRDGDVLQVPDVRAAPGGSRQPAGAGPEPAAPRLGRLLVLGGARSGKSAYAEQRLASEPAVTYVATAPPRAGDDDWTARVAAHAGRRPGAWSTVESGAVAELLADADGPLMIDDLGLWLTRVLDAADGWDRPSPAVPAAMDALVQAWRGCRVPAVLVAPEVGGGVVPAHASGRLFRDLLGALTSRLAAQSDSVVQVVAGLPRVLR